MKADIFVEIFLWNKNVDSLVRVLQRMEALGIWSKQEMRSFEVRLEELRSNLNADFALTMLRREHADHWRLREERREPLIGQACALPRRRLSPSWRL
jgi:hypothetical protein